MFSIFYIPPINQSNLNWREISKSHIFKFLQKKKQFIATIVIVYKISFLDIPPNNYFGGWPRLAATEATQTFFDKDFEPPSIKDLEKSPPLEPIIKDQEEEEGDFTSEKIVPISAENAPRKLSISSDTAAAPTVAFFPPAYERSAAARAESLSATSMAESGWQKSNENGELFWMSLMMKEIFRN